MSHSNSSPGLRLTNNMKTLSPDVCAFQNLVEKKHSTVAKNVEILQESYHSLSRTSGFGTRVNNECLKETVLLQLDLIQQLQTTIKNKDQQIKSLTLAKHALQCRLERMERRLSLLRQKNLKKAATVPTNQEQKPHVTSSQRPTDVRNEHPANMSPVPSTPEKRGLKRKIRYSEEDLMTCSSDFKESPRRGLPRDSPARRVSLTTPSSAPRAYYHDLGEPLTSPLTPRSPARRLHSARGKSSPRHPPSVTISDETPDVDLSRRLSLRSAAHRTNPRLAKYDGVHLSSTAYYTTQPIREEYPTGKPISEEGNTRKPIGETGKALSAGQKPDQYLELPTWRVNVLPRGWQLEGTENLEDEIFEKRHQKPETEEKRRKRWDLQRTREQEVVQKLLSRRRYGNSISPKRDKGKDDEIPTSFEPDVEQIQFVEVCDSLPVGIFGSPLPCITPSEFSLPWEVKDSKKLDEHKRTKRVL